MADVMSKDAMMKYIDSLVGKYTRGPDINVDCEKVHRIMKRRGFDTSEWKPIVARRLLPRLRSEVYWEGDYMGEITMIGSTMLFFNKDGEESTI